MYQWIHAKRLKKAELSSDDSQIPTRNSPERATETKHGEWSMACFSERLVSFIITHPPLDGHKQHCFCVWGRLELAWRRVSRRGEGSIKGFQDLASCLLPFSPPSDHLPAEGRSSEWTLLALITLVRWSRPRHRQKARDESFINGSQIRDNADNYLHGQEDKKTRSHRESYGSFSWRIPKWGSGSLNLPALQPTDINCSLVCAQIQASMSE